ncbi:Flp family type IVb pilin [Paraburkholderia fungorum]|uniref:Flp family type IVb pilin n=1 Tax=Paraburkholderia fungorum TaxID=134537 RepID=UPI0038BB62F2
MKKFTQRFLRDNKGVTAIEYGLIAGLLVVVIATAVSGMGGKLTSLFSGIGDQLNSATPAATGGTNGGANGGTNG